MKRYPVTPPASAPSAPSFPEAPEQISSEFDIERLLNNAGEILKREIRHLMYESSQGKLNAASSRNLVDYIRLLEEIRQKQKDDLENLTDEELMKIANSSNNSKNKS